MTDALWTRLADLVPDALDRPPTERDAFLRETCDGDALGDELLAEARSLVAAAEAADRDAVLDSLVPGFDDAPAALPDRIGPWQVTGWLGEGGMGVVYRAERADGLYDRTVALKRLRPGLGDTHVRRLETERRLLARLEHPGIARLYDAGVDADGAPFVVMELVEGTPLTDHADAADLDVPARLALFLDVCDAVAFAHGRLVVHRDIKPSNVFVATDGTVKLLDFGIATLLDTDGPGGGGEIQTQRVFTPAYAAPEQLRGGAVTTATDVYALGVTLFELLSGERPYSLSGTTAAETERIICETTPPPASAVAPPDRARRLRGDLDVIVARTLEKEPARRYASAEALGADLRRVLGGLPIEARPASQVYRARLFARRHRTAVLAAAAVVLALVAGLSGTAWQARTAALERDRAQTEAAKSRAVGDFLETMLASADPFQNDDAAAPESLTVAALLRRTSANLNTELAGQPEVRAAVHRTLGVTFVGLGLYADAAPHLRAALAERTRLYPDAAHPDRIQSLDDLAYLAFRLENVRQADSLQQIAVALFRQTDGPRSPEVATRLTRLAANRPRADAEPLFAEALSIMTARYGADAYEIVDVLVRHATQRMTFGDWVGADSLFARALAVAERHGHTDDIETATLRTNWSSAAFYLGHYTQAERLLRRSLAVQRVRLPADHPLLAETQSNWAGVLVEQGRYREAERLLRHTRDVFIREQPSWWARYAAGAELGAALAGQGRDAEAEPILRDNVDAMRRTAGDEHGWTRHFARHLVEFYDSRGRPDAAAPYRALVGY